VSEVLGWLSQNPAATIVLLVVLCVAVLVCLVAVLQGRSVKIWPITISARSTGPRGLVQIGHVDYPVAHEPFRAGKPKGRRWVDVPVTFDTPFARAPRVVVSLQKIDLGDPFGHSINRLTVSAENVARTGFQLRFETWEDSKVYGAAASWIAISD
jgi:hypothetical protein